jgi:hypothetical protein
MLILLLLLASYGPAAAPAAVPPAGDDPPVRVWFNSDGNYAYGDRAKVYAKSIEDGYVIVLRSDAAGRVRVLFPARSAGRSAGYRGQEVRAQESRGPGGLHSRRYQRTRDRARGHFQVAVSG